MLAKALRGYGAVSGDGWVTPAVLDDGRMSPSVDDFAKLGFYQNRYKRGQAEWMDSEKKLRDKKAKDRMVD